MGQNDGISKQYGKKSHIFFPPTSTALKRFTERGKNIDSVCHGSRLTTLGLKGM